MKDVTEKIKNVCEFYAITHRLKNTIRAGWQVWDVDTDRFESVAEHIYGTQMLALAINSEFGLGLDMARVAIMLAIHELGECIIGDIPVVGGEISRAEKQKLEMEAVEKILGGLRNSTDIKKLILEYEERKTKESKFTHMVDKLECDFQCKYYEEKGCHDMAKHRVGPYADRIEKYTKRGFSKLSSMWICNDIELFFKDDEVFKAIAEYIKSNNIF